jgi:hypothetical protein
MPASAIKTVISPRERDLGGGFKVRRSLPAIECRAVGPFVFFDQMGPTTFAAGTGLDVRPHPHIGLATVTYLFEGEILHRDSLGTVQRIRPGAVNWMTAGSGIAHSERTPPDVRGQDGARLAGIQIWVALPKAHEETAPSFSHHAAGTLPLIDEKGVSVRVILGEFHGARAPVPVFSQMFYADAALAAGARLDLPATLGERAVYVSDGNATIGDDSANAGQLVILQPGVPATITAPQAGRLLVFGGEPLDGPRHLWWNFVSSSQDRIEQAKEDWRQGRFAPVPGEPDFIPLPP